jgi:hypothetical protein
MDAKGHCKLRYGDGGEDEDADLEDFYDYSSRFLLNAKPSINEFLLTKKVFLSFLFLVYHIFITSSGLSFEVLFFVNTVFNNILILARFFQIWELEPLALPFQL